MGRVERDPIGINLRGSGPDVHYEVHWILARFIVYIVVNNLRRCLKLMPMGSSGARPTTPSLGEPGGSRSTRPTLRLPHRPVGPRGERSQVPCLLEKRSGQPCRRSC